MAADNNCILNRSKVVSGKVLKATKAKKISLESSFNAPDS